MSKKRPGAPRKVFVTEDGTPLRVIINRQKAKEDMMTEKEKERDSEECRFCRDESLIKVADYLVIWIEGSTLKMEFESFCNYEYPIQYCPICGRRL